MDIPAAQIEEVASFYTMFNLSPVGKHHIQVCCTLTCGMLGARELTARNDERGWLRKSWPDV